MAFEFESTKKTPPSVSFPFFFVERHMVADGDGAHAAVEGPPVVTKTAELWSLAWPAVTRNFLNCMADRITLALVG